jgi:GTP-binding protein
MNIRNIAIIAHVDHGKTTLVDQLLKSTGTFRSNEVVDTCVMDSNAIEKERGITIVSKATAVKYKDYTINILDTPGHADFGGEVERIMHMVDGCLLVVDAFEGTMPQTRFVLKKALEAHIKPIVVINKVDRKNANIKKTVDEVLNLFIELGAPDEFLDFPVAYCSALEGTSSLSDKLSDQKPGMEPILDMIIKYIHEPNVEVDGDFRFQPALLDYSDFVGRIGIGVISRGTVHINDVVACARLDGSVKNFRIQKLYGYLGLKRFEIEEAHAGEIVAIAGLTDINVGETLCSTNHIDPLPLLHIDEPTLQMTFAISTSPLVGHDGEFVQARKIEERLFVETQRDVSLKYERIPNTESWIVSGRGELHLGVLIEKMRREGFELQVSKPMPILKEINGVICEPYEDMLIDIPNDYTGTIIKTLGERDGQIVNMSSNETSTRLSYIIPSRGLIGFISNFLTLTKGYGIISHVFKEYRKKIDKDIGERKIGVLVATNDGKATPYAIERIEAHGTMFIKPGDEVYEGMIVGEHRYEDDLTVNVVLAKAMTNVRSSTKDFTVVLKAPRQMSLEACLDYINTDELVEITPSSYRMRKKILNTVERKKWDSRNK